MQALLLRNDEGRRPSNCREEHKPAQHVAGLSFSGATVHLQHLVASSASLALENYDERRAKNSEKNKRFQGSDVQQNLNKGDYGAGEGLKQESKAKTKKLVPDTQPPQRTSPHKRGQMHERVRRSEQGTDP